LAARKPLRWKVRQQCYDVKKGRPSLIPNRTHQSTQHVMNVGRLSPVRTIQIDLTLALCSCRPIVAKAPMSTPCIRPDHECLGGTCGRRIEHLLAKRNRRAQVEGLSETRACPRVEAAVRCPIGVGVHLGQYFSAGAEVDTSGHIELPPAMGPMTKHNNKGLHGQYH
jgi:hypothetical protein